MSTENLKRYIELDYKARRIAEALEQLTEFQLIIGAAIGEYYGEEPIVFNGVIFTPSSKVSGLYTVRAVTTVYEEDNSYRIR